MQKTNYTPFLSYSAQNAEVKDYLEATEGYFKEANSYQSQEKLTDFILQINENKTIKKHYDKIKKVVIEFIQHKKKFEV